MHDTGNTDDGDRNGRGATDAVGRRRFVALGAGASATLLAGCSGATDSGEPTADGDGTSDGSTTEAESDGAATAGGFRLLISDQPADIGDFEELNVTLDHARVFRGEGEDEDEEGGSETETGTEDETETAESTETATVEATAETTAEATEAESTDEDTADEAEESGDEDVDDDEDGEDADDGENGFSEISLDGATVDLTEVLGDKAVGVFDGELPTGRYTKVELHVRNAEGIVGGETVGVKVPSEKLQIVKPFEVVAGESLRFVFDINVVKKGNTGEYNLLPVISESGVAGKDVNVEEVGENDDGSDESDESDDTGTGESADGETATTEQSGGGSPDETGEGNADE